MRSDILYVYTDAASRGNPGPAAIAYSICDGSKKILYEKSEYIGEETNNVAEYRAIIAALEAASKFSDGDVKLFSDSELVVKQINGENRIKEEHLRKLFQEVRDNERFFSLVTYGHVPRETPEIARMDKLANRELNRQGK